LTKKPLYYRITDISEFAASELVFLKEKDKKNKRRKDKQIFLLSIFASFLESLYKYPLTNHNHHV